MPQTRSLLSVQTGQARRMRMAGRSLLTAMVKLPVQGPVPVARQQGRVLLREQVQLQAPDYLFEAGPSFFVSR
jgi:hypothetical protein